jgi:hypothetical protein
MKRFPLLALAFTSAGLPAPGPHNSGIDPTPDELSCLQAV